MAFPCLGPSYQTLGPPSTSGLMFLVMAAYGCHGTEVFTGNPLTRPAIASSKWKSAAADISTPALTCQMLQANTSLKNWRPNHANCSRKYVRSNQASKLWMLTQNILPFSNDKRLISQHLAVSHMESAGIGFCFVISGYMWEVYTCIQIIYRQYKTKSVCATWQLSSQSLHSQQSTPHPVIWKLKCGSCFFMLHALGAFCRKSSLSVGSAHFQHWPGH